MFWLDQAAVHLPAGGTLIARSTLCCAPAQPFMQHCQRPCLHPCLQDRLVMELRSTIRQLREDNRQLALAMSQLSTGGDASAALACLPESLRLAAGQERLAATPTKSGLPCTPSGGRGSMKEEEVGRGGSDTAGASSSTSSGTPAVSAGSGSSPAVAPSCSSRDTAGSNSGPGSPLPARQAAAAAAALGRGNTVSEPPTRLATLQPLAQQQCWQLSPRASLAASSRLSSTDAAQRSSLDAATSAIKAHRGGVGSRPLSSRQHGSGSRGGGCSSLHSKQGTARLLGSTGERRGARAPAHAWSTYPTASIAASAGMAGLEAGGLSEGRRHGRTSALQQQAALYGAGAYARPHTQPQRSAPGPAQRGMQRGQVGSCSAQATSGRQKQGSSTASAAPPRLETFPELDALELEFQQMLSSASAPAAPQQLQPPALSMGEGAASQQHITLHPPAPPPPQQQQQQQQEQQSPGAAPEPKALNWAQRNPWFGSDLQMTALAYQVRIGLKATMGGCTGVEGDCWVRDARDMCTGMAQVSCFLDAELLRLGGWAG